MGRYSQTLLILLVAILPQVVFAESFTAHCRDYPPELSFDGDKCVGVLPDLVTDIFSELGHEIRWKKAPWVRSLRDAKQGKVDLLIRHSMTEEREPYLYAIPYAYYVRSVYYYKSPKFDADIKNYAELEQVRVGAIRGNFYSPKFSDISKENITLVRKTEQLLAMLDFGRIDVAVTSASHGVERFDSQFDKVTLEGAFINPMYISLSKKSKAGTISAEVEELMRRYHESGRMDQYFERYGVAIPNQQ